MALHLTSPAFKEGGMIPAVYTCDGSDMSPPLTWDQVPEGTQSLALISDDPDAPMGTWVHWVVWNIPADAMQLPVNVAPDPELADGTRQGITDFGRRGYGGPAPPSGVHRYYFKLYALDALLDLPDSTTKADLLEAMQGHVLTQAQLVGKYRRQ